MREDGGLHSDVLALFRTKLKCGTIGQSSCIQPAAQQRARAVSLLQNPRLPCVGGLHTSHFPAPLPRRKEGMEDLVWCFRLCPGLLHLGGEQVIRCL